MALAVGAAPPTFVDGDGAPWPVVEHGTPADVPDTAQTVRPTLDRDGLLRNPATGWMLYDDASGPVAQAAAYWKAQDEAARHASIFYVRWRWAEAEPAEGRYAWRDDPNFKALIQAALDRGLRLAFRFYVASQDNTAQATPQYVRDAGAQGIMETGAGGKKLWTPYLDDPVFQAKFSAFVAAFAKEFDDPARVDFVDALGLGWWGEGHHLTLGDPAHLSQVYRWILDTYSTRFNRVLLGMQYGTGFGWALDEDWALRGEDYVIRRDGLGSHWFGDFERARFAKLWPRSPLYGERCYWGGGAGVPAQVAKSDPRYGARIKTWRDLDEVAIEDALAFHANTLDLRTIADARNFLTYPELIARFQRDGGYRLAPVEVRVADSVRAGDALVLRHAWVNLGVGVLPNANRRWGRKYRPAFALLAAGQDTSGDNLCIERDAEPGDWLRGAVHVYTTTLHVSPATAAGDYTLACAMLNTRHDGMPDLRLALKSECRGSWYTLGQVHVTRR
jgi:hypothetical protein